MDEKYLEMAQAQEERERQEGLKRIKKYTGNHTHCKIEGCGLELPEARRSIGLCIDCAEDEEKLAKKHGREYNTQPDRISNPDTLFESKQRLIQEIEDEEKRLEKKPYER